MISRLALAAALAAIGGAAAAQTPDSSMSGGYVTNSARDTARGAFGQCVRTGYWTPALAAEPCDATPRAAVPPVPVARAEPAVQAAPAPQPEPTPLAAAPRPVIEKVTLSSDVLFEFGKATLRDSGKEKLDQLAGRISGANVEEIVAVGHADRIDNEQRNQRLSEERAQAVKGYLVDKGLDPQLVKTEGKGESQPVTACGKMGAERSSNKKLVECLQPDRRVDIEVFGTRETSGTGSSSGAGASGATTGR
jgi:OOP family OmpA-OmpF porin